MVLDQESWNPLVIMRLKLDGLEALESVLKAEVDPDSKADVVSSFVGVALGIGRLTNSFAESVLLLNCFPTAETFLSMSN